MSCCENLPIQGIHWLCMISMQTILLARRIVGMCEEKHDVDYSGWRSKEMIQRKSEKTGN